MTPLTPVLSRFWDEPEPWSMETYRRHDGYRALDKALKMDPDDLIATVKDSGLRGAAAQGSRRAPNGRSSRRTTPAPVPSRTTSSSTRTSPNPVRAKTFR